MTKRLAYVNSFADRYGVRRYYFRRFGKRKPLPGKPGQPEFERAYADALKASTRGIVKKDRVGPRSMAALIRSYRSDPDFIGCGPSTQRAYNQALKEIEEAWGKYPVAGLTRTKINELMVNRAHDPKRANRLHKRLRAIMEHAVDIGWITVNPVRARRFFRVKTDSHPIWPATDIERFHKRWPRGTKERVAFDLLLFLGQRSSDTVTMARNHIDGGKIRVQQQKTGTTGWIPLHADLRATLEAGPLGGLYLIETRTGSPRSVKGFYNWMKAAAAKAGCSPELSPHGLRVAAATRLIEAGATAAEAAAVTMHKSLAELERYVKSRDQESLASAAILKLERNRNET